MLVAVRALGDYRLLRRLGKGAMAEVYLAEQISLGRNVAFKVLKPELAIDEKYVQRFNMEARAAAAVSFRMIWLRTAPGFLDRGS